MRERKIVIPVRRSLSLPEDFIAELGEVVVIEAEDDRIVIRPAEGICVICCNVAAEYFFGKGVCTVCLNHARMLHGS